MHNSLSVPSVITPELTPAHLFRSPLKRPRPPMAIKAYDTIKADHLGYKTKSSQEDPRPLKRRAFVISSQTLKEIKTENLPESLEVAVRAIEETARIKRVVNLALVDLRHRIIRILDNDQLTEGQKLTELGLIYFYLTTNKTLPISSSLLEARMEEIEKEALILLEEHKSHCLDKNTIPSGSIHYIHRAFVHMIFTPEGKFNKGGCLAVLQLLNSRLSLLLTEEIEDQIFRIAQKLLHDDEFLNLFLEPFNVDPKMEEFIVTDLKVTLPESLPFSYVQWALLMSLFSVVYQKDEGDCYLISLLSNLLTDDSTLLLKMMIDLFKTGVVRIDGVEVSVSLIFKGKATWEKEMKLKMKSSQASSLTPFIVAKEVFQVSQDSQLDPTAEFVLKDIFDSTFGSSTRAAQQIFNAHKINSIQRMMIAVLQFIARNHMNNSYNLSTSKGNLFCSIGEFYEIVLDKMLEKKGVENDPLISEFVNKFYDHICSKFYVVDCRNWNYSVEDGRIVYDFHPVGFLQSTNPHDTTTSYLSRPFQFITRLLWNNRGELVPVDSLTHLSAALVACVNEVASASDTRIIRLCTFTLKKYFKSPNFLNDMAHMLENLNNARNLSLNSKAYLDSDSFFLTSSGASFSVIADFGQLQGKYSTAPFSSRNVREFFDKTCSCINNFMRSNPKFDQKLEPQILIRHNGHAFNLTPTRFLNLKDSIDDTIIKQALFLLSSIITPAQRIRIILLSEGEAALDLYRHLLIDEMSAAEFKLNMLAELDEMKHREFKTAFNRVLQEVPYTKMAAFISPILKECGKELTPSETIQIQSYLSQKRNGLDFLNPYKGARLLRKALLSLESPIRLPSYKLEQSIRSLFTLPQVALLGRLNWVVKDKEKPKYIDLVLNFDFAEAALTLSRRRNGIDYVYEALESLLQSSDLSFAA